jgi:antitoxin (DNA-binding transcriptional repressor) of toxin-antitoxin stability system
MEDVDLRHAKEHLEELLERAAKGEDVRITDPRLGTIRLTAIASAASRAVQRVPGRWKDRLPPPPAGFFDPMTDAELKDK